VLSVKTSAFGCAIPCRRAARFADDALLLRLPRSDEVAKDDQSGGNAAAGFQRNGRTECSHGPDQRQACPYRPFGVVLMGLG
jgi:hypothetical protein